MYNVIGMRIRGFTLVELMITIGIVAILSSMLYSIGPSSRQFARDSRRKADLEQIRSGLELYRSSNGQYPACNPALSAGCLMTSASVPQLSSGYLSSIPGDPVSGRTYAYKPWDVSGGGCNDTGSDKCVTYTLCAALEKVTTPVTVGVCASISNPCGSGVSCSLAVSNP